MLLTDISLTWLHKKTHQVGFLFALQDILMYNRCMDKNTIIENLQKWMIEFIEKPNPLLGNWSPCPFARSARINNKISFQFSEVDGLYTTIKSSLPLLDEKEVIVICFDHTMLDAITTQEHVEAFNKELMPKNYVILEDHPDAPEYVNKVKMNFGDCGLLILQKLDKLTTASEQLSSKGYYDVWSKDELDSVVNWR
jgi:hypothetical protein